MACGLTAPRYRSPGRDTPTLGKESRAWRREGAPPHLLGRPADVVQRPSHGGVGIREILAGVAALRAGPEAAAAIIRRHLQAGVALSRLELPVARDRWTRQRADGCRQHPKTRLVRVTENPLVRSPCRGIRCHWHGRHAAGATVKGSATPPPGKIAKLAGRALSFLARTRMSVSTGPCATPSRPTRKTASCPPDRAGLCPATRPHAGLIPDPNAKHEGIAAKHHHYQRVYLSTRHLETAQGCLVTLYCIQRDAWTEASTTLAQLTPSHRRPHPASQGSAPMEPRALEAQAERRAVLHWHEIFALRIPSLPGRDDISPAGNEGVNEYPLNSLLQTSSRQAIYVWTLATESAVITFAPECACYGASAFAT